MGARVYDPSIGRFTSRDPVPGEPSEPRRQDPYAYALSNPLRYYDLDGRFAEPLVGTCVEPVNPLCVAGVIGTLVTVGGIVYNQARGGEVDLPNSNAIGKDNGNSADDAASGAEPNAPRSWADAMSNPESLRGKTAEEIEQMIPEDWVRQPARNGDWKWVNPERRGEQIIIEQGGGEGSTGVHAGPYVRVSHGGKVTRVPLAGNPTL